MVFANRNKEYGAYRLRRQAGARYRWAITVVVGAFVLLVGFYVSVSLYVRHVLRKEVQAAEEALKQMHMAELRDDYKVKFVATARMAPPVRMAPGATQLAPEIVEGTPKPSVLGIKGSFSFDPDQAVITSPIIDTTGLGNKALPLTEEKIVPTEVVSQLPEFPGGARAFMRWLNDHITYPRQCMDRKLQGDVVLSFIVDTDGYAKDFEVENAFDPLVRRNVLNALNRMPKWKPGIGKDGKPTPVRITVPVKYQI